jgi:hypothetical protein
MRRNAKKLLAERIQIFVVMTLFSSEWVSPVGKLASRERVVAPADVARGRQAIPLAPTLMHAKRVLP